MPNDLNLKAGNKSIHPTVIVVLILFFLISSIPTTPIYADYDGSSQSPSQWSCPIFAPPVVAGYIGFPEINEASGIAASRKNENVLWTHNDSPTPKGKYIYAMNKSGAHLGRYQFQTNDVDTEDIAIGPGPNPDKDYLYVGDIGDNPNSRSNIKVFRVEEPEVSDAQLPVDLDIRSQAVSFTFVYPDGPRDAETLMVDTNGDIYIVTKRKSPFARVYRATYPQLPGAVTTLEFVAQLPWALNYNGGPDNGSLSATAGDISKDGRLIIVRRYAGQWQHPPASVWYRAPGTDLPSAFNDATRCDISFMSPDGMGEAVGFDADGMGFYTTSEAVGAPILYYARVAVCGNGFVEKDVSRTEECDDGNITDSDGCSSICTFENNPPVVNAGPDHVITSPTNFVQLHGSASDDGLPNPPGLMLISWSQIGGPNTATIFNPFDIQPHVSDLVPGTYIFRITANDNATISSDDVVITVNPAPFQKSEKVNNPNETATSPKSRIASIGIPA